MQGCGVRRLGGFWYWVFVWLETCLFEGFRTAVTGSASRKCDMPNRFVSGSMREVFCLSVCFGGFAAEAAGK